MITDVTSSLLNKPGVVPGKHYRHKDHQGITADTTAFYAHNMELKWDAATGQDESIQI
ncbi:hypothetical protein [Methanogenium cariaci]|jgi:hypothetical protein|uniref:hypothetical protein n=1 Tax=Methanogenium cariaci TaxID=2197 RepID=UPI00155DB848|nr:hypothetical protein [Methanogenium cariaci]